MTDKQIILDGMECRYWFRPNPTDYRKCSLRGQDDNCDEIKDCFIKELLGKLKAKEQECEELKKIINEAKNSKLDLNSFFAIEATIGEYCLELDRLKAKNDELMKQHQADKGLITSTGKQNYQLIQEYDKLKNCLTEIKPILEFYANSKMGEEQPDRTYKIMLSGGYIMVYDPKPARQALQKISEVLE